ncbi:MAG: prepilin-type N-terminal cleavage/methylation domain-containing protein, partial [Gammaproteobacteria bacterium]|nr:prepilin-type N-terminal cleavage/methylation domain-containing protein [Gammaproteobacteria bacterium]
HGFTLIELVLTIIILGVLSAFAAPRFFNQNAFDQRYFYDDLISAARYAQRLSTGSGCAVRLTVSGTGFSLLQDNNCDLSNTSYTLIVNRPSDSVAFSNANVPSGLTITSNKALYDFLPAGKAVDVSGVSVGNATITLTSSTTTDRTINIVGDTGYAY